MKKFIVAVMAALLVNVAAEAQDSQSQGRRPGRQFDQTEMTKRRTDMTVERYKLNDEQAKQLLALNEKYAGKIGGRMGMRGFMGRPGGDGSRGQRGGRGGRGGQMRPDSLGRGPQGQPTEEQRARMETMRQEMEANLKAYNEELQKIMTSEQFQQYQADQQRFRQGGGQRGPRRDRQQ